MQLTPEELEAYFAKHPMQKQVGRVGTQGHTTSYASVSSSSLMLW